MKSLLKRKKPQPDNTRRPKAINRNPNNPQPVFSYYNNGAKQRSSAINQEKVINLAAKPAPSLRLLPTLVACAVIVFSILFSMTLSTKPGVTTFNDQPSPYRQLDEYAAAADEIMRGSLGNRTKLTIQTSDIESALLERFPELNAAVLRLPVLGRKPSLVIDIRPPEIILTSTNSNYVLDSSGTVISELKALAQENRTGLLTVKDESGLKAEVGKQILPADTVEFINEVTAQLDAKGLKITSLTLPASANQLDVRIEGLNYYLKTDLSGDPRLQMGSFLAVKEKLEKDKITPSEYIDVRVEEKVFYK